MTLTITIPGYSETKPVYYNVQVSFERTTFHIKRRYSEFEKLAAALLVEMGEKPPVDLPGKKWGLNPSPEYLDERRRGLEKFLRAIARKDEWRETLAFADFLELSTHLKREAQESNRARADWAKIAAETESLLRDHSRKNQVIAAANIKMLESGLASSQESLGLGEYRRRRDILASLRQSLSSGANGSESRALFERTPPRVLGGGPPGGETDRTRALNNQGLLQLQQSDMEKQDDTVARLLESVTRQKQLGLAINDELQYHNQLLDQLDGDTHSVNARLNQAKRRTNKLNN